MESASELARAIEDIRIRIDTMEDLLERQLVEILDLLQQGDTDNGIKQLEGLVKTLGEPE